MQPFARLGALLRWDDIDMDISREDFDNISSMIKEKSGICLGNAKTSFLASKLAHRLKETNSESVKEYYFYLKYDSKGMIELDNLIETVTVGETFFFRHQEQLDDFAGQVLPEILKHRRNLHPLSIWSAGCSSGEEAYTLAIMLLESNCKLDRDSINIMASDISASALHSAREGIYDDYSVRNVPRGLLYKYFEKTAKGKYLIAPTIKQIVRFASINLMDYRSTSRVRNVDCIFCRNVIIYFDEKDKRRCVEHLYESLSEDGYVFLGHSESLGRISNLFEPLKLRHTVAYRKPVRGTGQR